MELKTHRYQINKITVMNLHKGHPWIFRKNLSSAIDGIPVESLMHLVDGDNKLRAHAIYEPLGVVGMRVITGLSETPTIEDFKNKIEALVKVKSKNNAYRLINGEADGFPGLTADVYNKTVVWQPYLKYWMQFIEELDGFVRDSIHTDSTVVKPAGNVTDEIKVIGDVVEPLPFTEFESTLHTYPITGQKTGFYLDLRKVRRVLSHFAIGKTVLNTFANNGTLSMLSMKYGAKEITSIEASDKCREYAKTLFEANGEQFDDSKWITGDVWDELKKMDQKFDIIILDPPQMASKKTKVKNALKAWLEMHETAKKHLNEDGVIFSISCTSILNEYITIGNFAKAIGKCNILKKGGLPGDHTLNQAFPEGDYLKWWVVQNV